MKPGKYFKSTLTMLIVAVALLLTTSAALATEGHLNYDTAIVDGDPSEWDPDENGADFFAYMIKSGGEGVGQTEVTGYLYLRYVCPSDDETDGTMYVYVNSPDYEINTSSIEDTFVKIDGSKVVGEGKGTLVFVEGEDSRVEGWEASFELPVGSYSMLVHNIFYGDDDDDTSSTPSSPPISVNPYCSCTGATITAVVCEDLNEDGHCQADEPRFDVPPHHDPAYMIPVQLTAQGSTVGIKKVTNSPAAGDPAVFTYPTDAFTVPGDKTLTVIESFLFQPGQQYVPTTPTSYDFPVFACATIEREFGFVKSSLGFVGDLVWYDAIHGGVQDEWYDANGNNKVDKYKLDLALPTQEYEWIDVNGDDSYLGEDNEGELNKCGIGGVKVELLDENGALLDETFTNPYGYYRFYGLQLEGSRYRTRIDPDDAKLDTGRLAYFNNGYTLCSSLATADTFAAATSSTFVEASAVNDASCTTTDVTLTSEPLTDENNNDLTLDYPTYCVDSTVAVSLSLFEAKRDGENVHFRWETATETGNAGFNLYVETSNGMAPINESLIPSSVIDSVELVTYSYSAAVEGDLFYIEMVDINSWTDLYGPFSATESAGTPDFDRESAIWIPMISH